MKRISKILKNEKIRNVILRVLLIIIVSVLLCNIHNQVNFEKTPLTKEEYEQVLTINREDDIKDYVFMYQETIMFDNGTTKCRYYNDDLEISLDTDIKEEAIQTEVNSIFFIIKVNKDYAIKTSTLFGYNEKTSYYLTGYKINNYDYQTYENIENELGIKIDEVYKSYVDNFKDGNTVDSLIKNSELLPLITYYFFALLDFLLISCTAIGIFLNSIFHFNP
ncbi:MAG: hypothetical protein ACK5LC_03335, partial [Coprobacillaceae bacterium]